MEVKVIVCVPVEGWRVRDSQKQEMFGTAGANPKACLQDNFEPSRTLTYDSNPQPQKKTPTPNPGGGEGPSPPGRNSQFLKKNVLEGMVRESRVRPPHPPYLSNPSPGGDEGPSPPRCQQRNRRFLR